ncbi:adhesion G protein-coupled receptor E5-like [Eucyclogobius newberryi]|uniref:adhesion G protein-coupled receptor E5-like n=1 Tax=Eucyclogobius newberryi TaxID=166745 RepID=UPI003B5C0364
MASDTACQGKRIAEKKRKETVTARDDEIHTLVLCHYPRRIARFHSEEDGVGDGEPGTVLLGVRREKNYLITTSALEYLITTSALEYLITTSAVEYLISTSAVEYLITTSALEYLITTSAVEYLITTSAVEYLISTSAVEYLITTSALEYLITTSAVEYLITTSALEYLIITSALEYLITTSAVEYLITTSAVEYLITTSALEYLITTSAVEYLITTSAVEYLITTSALEYLITTTAVEYLITTSAVEYLITTSALEYLITTSAVEYLITTSAIITSAQRLPVGLSLSATKQEDAFVSLVIDWIQHFNQSRTAMVVLLDIDECAETSTLCGSDSECVNDPGKYHCLCLDGYQATNTSLAPAGTNPCIDIDECLDNACGPYGDCTNTVGNFTCDCHDGFEIIKKGKPPCQDIDECLDKKVCGPDSTCTNTIGAFTCKCDIGYVPTNESSMARADNPCIDMDECTRFSIEVDPFKKFFQTICGPSCNCTNTIGSYYCTCFSGYRISNREKMASRSNPCIDIDECVETPGICGVDTICTNYPGTFYCSCPEGYYPDTGLYWTVGVTYCQNVQEIINELKPPEGQTKEGVFLGKIDEQLNNLTDIPTPTIANSFSASMEVAGVGPRARSSRVSSSGDGTVGSLILGLSDRLVATMRHDVYNQTTLNVKNSAVDLSMETYGYSGNNKKSAPLVANGNAMQLNMDDLAENNNGSAAAAFFTLNGMESLLSHQYLKTENRTEMFSDVISAVLPTMNNTNISDPVNFTIQHKKSTYESGMVTCVYWKVEKNDEGKVSSMGWSTEGCTMTFSNENYTVCSCIHLSTFALILQITDPPPQNDFLDWLNRICVIVGLFFFALAVLTFLLCSWNPKINNTARLHLCLNLGLSHLLMLWNDRYLDDKLACKVMAGLLHFLIVGSFVWMLLEATQLFMLVRKLTKVQVIKRDGLPRPLLYFVGYGVPLVVVGVSALVYSDGYGATAGACWLTTTRSFNWALTGPVIAILGMNCVLFGATLWSLRTTLANMKSGASDSKDARLVLFKIVAQFVILGCTWILGLYQSNLFFQVAFIILNSQQGTLLFVVHCILNKEIRDEYVKWLTCSFKNKEDDGEENDLPSVSEDMDKTK